MGALLYGDEMSTIVIQKTTTTGAGAGHTVGSTTREGLSVQATVTGTGSVTATVDVECSNDAVTWALLGTIVLSGTTKAGDMLPVSSRFEYVRSNVTAISGTGAQVTATLSV